MNALGSSGSETVRMSKARRIQFPEHLLEFIASETASRLTRGPARCRSRTLSALAAICRADRRQGQETRQLGDPDLTRFLRAKHGQTEGRPLNYDHRTST